MSCGKCGENKPPASDDCSGGGFFSWFGGGGGSSSGGDSGRCKNCGLENCNCNCNLRDHLKECCGLGQLPPLVTKDSCPVPKSKKSADPCDDPCETAAAKKPYDCAAEAKRDNCALIVWPKDPPSSSSGSSGNGCGCVDQGAAAPPKNQKKPCCLPETNVEACVPSWICPPQSSGVKYYYPPSGVTVYPISYKPRGGGSGGSKESVCGCGSGKEAKSGGAPNVANKACPMLRSKNCEKKEKDEGIFAKIMNFFNGLFGKKK